MQWNIWSEIPAISRWMNSSWCCDLVHCAAIFSFVKVRQIKKTHKHTELKIRHTYESIKLNEPLFFMIACRFLDFGHQRFIASNEQHEHRTRQREKEKKHQHTHLMTDILSADVILKRNFWNSTKQKRSICIFLAKPLVIGHCYMSAKSRTYFLMIKIWNIFVCSFLSGEIQLIIGCFSFSWIKLRLWRISTVDKYIQSVWVLLYSVLHIVRTKSKSAV